MDPFSTYPSYVDLILAAPLIRSKDIPAVRKMWGAFPDLWKWLGNVEESIAAVDHNTSAHKEVVDIGPETALAVMANWGGHDAGGGADGGDQFTGGGRQVRMHLKAPHVMYPEPATSVEVDGMLGHPSRLDATVKKTVAVPRHDGNGTFPVDVTLSFPIEWIENVAELGGERGRFTYVD